MKWQQQNSPQRGIEIEKKTLAKDFIFFGLMKEIKEEKRERGAVIEEKKQIKFVGVQMKVILLWHILAMYISAVLINEYQVNI